MELALIMQDCFGSPSYELDYECYVQVPGWYRSRCVVAMQECTEKITRPNKLLDISYSQSYKITRMRTRDSVLFRVSIATIKH